MATIDVAQLLRESLGISKASWPSRVRCTVTQPASTSVRATTAQTSADCDIIELLWVNGATLRPVVIPKGSHVIRVLWWKAERFKEFEKDKVQIVYLREEYKSW